MADAPQTDMAKQTVQLELPGADAVQVRRELEFPGGDGAALALDVYAPPGATGPRPAVVFVAGYADEGMAQVFGCRFKELGSSVSWARLVAASGLVGITYTNREPAADAHALVAHLRAHGPALGVDAGRIGLWSSSGNVPVTLGLLLDQPAGALACAALCYGFTLDPDGPGPVARAAAIFGFDNPGAGRSVAELPSDVPLLLARAGQDAFDGLNATLDRFAADALSRNLPLTLINHPTGAHAFDLVDGSAATQRVVRQVLAFLVEQLGG